MLYIRTKRLILTSVFIFILVYLLLPATNSLVTLVNNQDDQPQKQSDNSIIIIDTRDNLMDNSTGSIPFNAAAVNSTGSVNIKPHTKPKIFIRYHHYSDIGLEHFSGRPSARPCEMRPFILLMINSKPSHIKRRMGIRKTWGNGTEVNAKANHPHAWRTIFVIGNSNDAKLNQQTEQESMQYGDMILGNFIDNMQNLTEKSIMSMAWANRFCKPIYMYKGDDDVFVNLNLLYNFMQTQARSNRLTRFWIGRVDGSTLARRVVRKKNHKYYVSEKDYPQKLFPRFCSGFAYIMSGDVITAFLNQVPKTKKLKTVDDAYIAILGKKAGLVPRNDIRFHLFIEPKPKHRYTVHELRRRFAEHDITTEAKQKQLHNLARTGTRLYISYTIPKQKLITL